MLDSSKNKIFQISKMSIWWSSIDKTTVAIVVCLMLFGWVEMCSVGLAIGKRTSINPIVFWGKQALFIAVGVTAMLTISMLSINSFAKIAVPIFTVLLISLIGILIFGDATKGSKRWIKILGVNVQPSELLKPFFIVINGIILGNNKIKPKGALFISAALFFTIAVLLFLEPDIGMMVVYFVAWCTQTVVANVPMFIYQFLVIAIPIFGGLTYFSLPHIRYRIDSFLTGDQPYQVKKSLLSMANGGFFGKGFGDGDIKYQLPDSHSDYIFSAIGEEWGLIVCLIILSVYFVFIVNLIKQTMWEENDSRRIIGFGLIAVFFIHIFISVGVGTNLLPPKGTTLPFISYGGSSILSACINIGILLILSKSRQGFNGTFEKIKKKNFWDLLIRHKGRTW
ncbi:MAG: FtsW/RodA/SpoVE family cell cycle protein [Alphaproteobacteria bacterium]|nr:FtsW/RodA/SpoVE family cell cycle protein [Rickettsiales bacterium]